MGEVASLKLGSIKPLPLALKQIEVMVKEMGESGTDLLERASRN
jgi:hypothetical protein